MGQVASSDSQTRLGSSVSSEAVQTRLEVWSGCGRTDMDVMDDFTTLYAYYELFLVSLSLLFVFTHIQYALVQSSDLTGRLAVY